ncbi:DUF1294 domain-containing protein [Armatimonas sp.]|uniref:DUF1294 domain-containing protein n=1 Tax=Armatimonas sp. TaxID=1872638 RepID=UPI00286BB607|nr:DUF1294 domain-containing protein [Armatimonas sp.]
MLRYIPGTDDRGRLQALRVEFLVEVTEPAHFRWTLATWGALIFVALFLMALLATVFVGKLPFYIPLVSILLSSILFTEYQHDKKAAQASRWRTAENRLHLLSLLGGWPGALVAQQGLRHKSRKTAFLVPFWITVILNIAALGIFSNVFSALQSPARVSGYEHFRSSH